MGKQASFRFYAELNDFLPATQKYQSFIYSFTDNPSIKDSIEAAGVPHTEVDLILANGSSIGFDYCLQNGDSVSIYPVFESLAIFLLSKLRAKPLRDTRFILDVHLRKLAGKLRMLGFDTLYRNDYMDSEIIYLSMKEKRIILTRDRGILMNKSVRHGYRIRSSRIDEQIQEVLQRFDLFSQIRAFHRCMICNGNIKGIDKEKVLPRLLPKTILYYDEIHTCCECDRLYRKGSYYQNMEVYIEKLKSNI